MILGPKCSVERTGQTGGFPDSQRRVCIPEAHGNLQRPPVSFIQRQGGERLSLASLPQTCTFLYYLVCLQDPVQDLLKERNLPFKRKCLRSSGYIPYRVLDCDDSEPFSINTGGPVFNDCRSSQVGYKADGLPSSPKVEFLYLWMIRVIALLTRTLSGQKISSILLRKIIDAQY